MDNQSKNELTAKIQELDDLNASIPFNYQVKRNFKPKVNNVYEVSKIYKKSKKILNKKNDKNPLTKKYLKEVKLPPIELKNKNNDTETEEIPDNPPYFFVDESYNNNNIAKNNLFMRRFYLKSN